MTNLKTLKDFEQLPRNKDVADYNCALDDLKAEAIKWVKETDEKGMDRDFNDKNEFWDYGADTRNWIKHFFNLTEEDLK